MRTGSPGTRPVPASVSNAWPARLARYLQCLQAMRTTSSVLRPVPILAWLGNTWFFKIWHNVCGTCRHVRKTHSARGHTRSTHERPECAKYQCLAQEKPAARRSHRRRVGRPQGRHLPHERNRPGVWLPATILHADLWLGRSPPAFANNGCQPVPQAEARAVRGHIRMPGRVQAKSRREARSSGRFSRDSGILDKGFGGRERDGQGHFGDLRNPVGGGGDGALEGE